MFTKQDKKFLQQTFATKDDLKAMEARQDKKLAYDLKAMEARQDKKYATKDDLKAMEARQDKKLAYELEAMEARQDKKLAYELEAMEARQDKKYASKEDLANGLRSLKSEILVELSKTRDEIIRQIADLIHDQIIPMFDHFDKRIHRIEKKLGLPPLVD